MAMSPEDLASELETAVDGISGKLKDNINTVTYKKEYYLTLATVIIAHIQKNASVNGGTCTPGGAIEDGKVS